jgi:hypothetical protein
MAVSPGSGQVALLSIRQLQALSYIDQIQLEGTILDAQIQVSLPQCLIIIEASAMLANIVHQNKIVLFFR